MRSVLGWFSPYVRSLEERVEYLETDRKRLIDRIVRLTTGYGLDEPVPNAAEEAEKSIELTAKQRDAAFSTRRPRPEEVVRRAEHLSNELAAQALGIDLSKELEEVSIPRQDFDPKVDPAVRVLDPR